MGYFDKKTRVSRTVILTILFSCGVSAQTSWPKVTLGSLENFTQGDSLRLMEEIHVLETKVLENRDFWEAVKNCDFKCSNRLRIRKKSTLREGTYPRKYKRETFRKDYTNEEIYQMLFNGNDLIGVENDGEINLNLRLDDKKFNTVTNGKTSGFYQRITSYRSKTIDREKGTYAAHILHEYMHLLGFIHKSQKTKRNKRKCGGNDVPYSIGKLAKQFLGLEVVGEDDLCL